MAVITDVSKLWQSLGSFWSTFEDKELIEVIWEAYREVLTEKYRDAYQINLSKAFQYMPSSWEDRYQYYDVIYAADDAIHSGLVNTVVVSGLHNYYLSDNVYSIASGLYNWYYQDANNERAEEILVEGTDFVIEDYNRIVFLNNPPFTANNSIANISTSKLFAPVVHSLNPALFALFGALVAITKEHLENRDYHAFETGATDAEQVRLDLRHFKYFIWALHYLKKQMPTITNIKKLYGIGRGVPFAYNIGTVTRNTLGNDSEDTNKELHIGGSGHVATKFNSTETSLIHKVKAYFKTDGDPLTAYCAIYDDDGGAPSTPNNKIADAIDTVTASGLDWYEFDFDNVIISGGTSYWLSVAAFGDSCHYYRIDGDADQCVYKYGVPPSDPFGTPEDSEPFAYNIYADYFPIASGLNSDTYQVDIDDDSYYIPTTLKPGVEGGDSVGQFDLLVSGINIYDWYNNNTRIQELVEQDWQEKAFIELISDSSLDILDYNQIFVNGLVEDILPNYLTTYYS